MYSIKWLTLDGENEIALETSVYSDLEEVVASCIKRLPAAQLRFSQTPPDGFVIFDSDGNEVRRWFSSARIRPIRN